jgi:hypothetical protein
MRCADHHVVQMLIVEIRVPAAQIGSVAIRILSLRVSGGP